ncbi:hypothetical protein SAMN05421858_3477 [Haladaptatus litoreus]|uniref:Uncharacterized protein n=1 Tax=Haladaptatus litoreus TaxID=553468 RepID=A0A1N7DB96_9EURY|nr:hypothetical protein SAMN05421858_3477 [Haladaptatus litoreus]
MIQEKNKNEKEKSYIGDKIQEIEATSEKDSPWQSQLTSRARSLLATSFVFHPLGSSSQVGEQHYDR